jgi:hypothetical protein
MITESTRQRFLAQLHGLRAGGGCPDSPAGPPDPGATLSVLKSLGLLGSRPTDPDSLHAWVLDRLDSSTVAPAVLPTAAGLLCLHALGATETLGQRLDPDLRWLAANATTREEHFMTIAVAEECGSDLPLPRSVAFFRALEQADGTFGPGALQNAIAASALLRAGARLRKPRAVAAVVLAAQSDSGAFADDLWTSYCAMRLLDLLGIAPDRERLADWVLRTQLDGRTFSANATYQCLSILDWIARPVLDAARHGDVAAIRRHLRGGGDPDLRDLRGWTPLAAAAVRGQAAVVRLLLSGDQSAAKAADPDVRVPDADALPVFWAGQAGDVDTVAAILEHRPEHLFATSSVNGHTVLLQATFFGTDKHRALASWLLDHAGDVLDLAADDRDGLDRARRRLLAACNVRGYTATEMATLWHNEALTSLLSTVDNTTAAERNAYRTQLLASIALPEPTDPVERAAQERTDALLRTISDGFDRLNASPTPQAAAALLDAVTAAVTAAVEEPGFDLNRRGGPLAQTPIIAAVTGTDANDHVSRARVAITSLLLRAGADPDLPELHPMAVDAVIRAAVLNHFDCLREIASFMGPLAFAAALNEQPAINGQTALDDTVHRALTASAEALPSHLDQIRWAIERGGRTDIADFTGVTVADRARLATDDPVLRGNAAAVRAALGV